MRLSALSAVATAGGSLLAVTWSSPSAVQAFTASPGAAQLSRTHRQNERLTQRGGGSFLMASNPHDDDGRSSGRSSSSPVRELVRVAAPALDVLKNGVAAAVMTGFLAVSLASPMTAMAAEVRNIGIDVSGLKQAKPETFPGSQVPLPTGDSTADQLARYQAGVKAAKEKASMSQQGVAGPQGATIAKLRVTISNRDEPLGLTDVSSFPQLNTDKSRLILSAFGRSGPPVAAKRLPLKGLTFPVTAELTDNDLCFPLTKSSWATDARAKEDIGIAVVLDVDGKLATLEGVDLTGFGLSKMVTVGGVTDRSEAAINVMRSKVVQEKGQMALSDEEFAMLDRVDSLLDFKEQQAAKGK